MPPQITELTNKMIRQREDYVASATRERSITRELVQIEQRKKMKKMTKKMLTEKRVRKRSKLMKPRRKMRKKKKKMKTSKNHHQKRGGETERRIQRVGKHRSRTVALRGVMRTTRARQKQQQTLKQMQCKI